jgi:hypothetical protein
MDALCRAGPIETQHGLMLCKGCDGLLPAKQAPRPGTLSRKWVFIRYVRLLEGEFSKMVMRRRMCLPGQVTMAEDVRGQYSCTRIPGFEGYSGRPVEV